MPNYLQQHYVAVWQTQNKNETQIKLECGIFFWSFPDRVAMAWQSSMLALVAWDNQPQRKRLAAYHTPLRSHLLHYNIAATNHTNPDNVHLSDVCNGLWLTVVTVFQDALLSDTDATSSAGSSHKKSSVASEVQMAINVEPALNSWRKLVALWLGHHKCIELLLTALSYLLFIMLLIQCVVAVSGCLSLGSSLPPATAHLWLFTVCMALLVYVFVFEPLKVLLIALHFALSQNKMLLI